MIIDTGVFVAAANASEPNHAACSGLLSEATETLVVPAMVIAEATYMIERASGPAAEAIFLRSMSSTRYVIHPPTAADLRRAAELVAQYADLPLGGTDASIIALAERIREPVLATLDHRHFSVVRPRHVRAFDLRP